jgi:hypothetical protein
VPYPAKIWLLYDGDILYGYDYGCAGIVEWYGFRAIVVIMVYSWYPWIWSLYGCIILYY